MPNVFGNNFWFLSVENKKKKICYKIDELGAGICYVER